MIYQRPTANNPHRDSVSGDRGIRGIGDKNKRGQGINEYMNS